ncbi:MAG: hypothetical protein ACI39Q_03570 [Wujia sp.]
MFNKFQKGEYGYLKSYRRSRLIVALILAAMIAFVIITMLMLFGDTGRIMIVFAILLTLPFAKFLIAWIMCARFTPLSADQYEHLCSVLRENGSENIKGLCFDVVITQYEGMKFFQSLCVKNGKIIALVLDRSYQENKKEYQKWIQNCTEDSKYKYTIQIFDDIDEYAKKVRSISTPNEKTAMIDKHILEKILTTCV